MLLHRWTLKWGMLKAILLSSFLFGIVHPDPIGAIAFGIAMSILYLQTQSLMIPILCHAANNLFVWLIEVGYRIVEGSEYQYTLKEFQDEWHIGVICGVLAVIWAIRYSKRPSLFQQWKLPLIIRNDLPDN